MNRLLLSLILFFSGVMFCSAGENVVLLHGLARTKKSMSKMEAALSSHGYKVLNINYPSREYSVEVLAEQIRQRVTDEFEDGETVHFVTHSMGGILVRHIQAVDPLKNIGRVVMLSPPNQGSEIVDKLRGQKMYYWINGPSGLQLGTEEQGFIWNLPEVSFELGVITGDRSINWILSTMISGPDDGKVGVERAKVEGMRDFKVVHATHPYIMKNEKVIQDTLKFLNLGKF